MVHIQVRERHLAVFIGKLRRSDMPLPFQPYDNALALYQIAHRSPKAKFLWRDPAFLQPFQSSVPAPESVKKNTFVSGCQECSDFTGILMVSPTLTHTLPNVALDICVCFSASCL
jgi:hypothetical protein